MASPYWETALFPFLYAFVIGHVIVALPIRASGLTSDPLLLGLIGTVLQAGIVLFCIVCGRISDRTPRWKMIVAGPLVCGGVVLMMSVAVEVVQLILLAGLVGLAASIFWPSLEAQIGDLTPQRQLAHSLSIFNISWSSGHGLGGLLSGILISFGVLLPFVCAGAGSLLLGLAILWYYRRVLRSRLSTVVGQKAVVEDTQDPRAGHFLLIARIASFGSYFSLGSLRWLFPKLGLDLGLSPQQIGGLAATLLGTQTVVFFAMGRIKRWQFSVVPFVLAAPVAMAALSLLGGTTSMDLFLIGFGLMGVCSGVLYTSALFYGLHTPVRRGTSAGMHETIIASGALVGPVAGGWIARYWGLRSPLYLAMAVVLLAAVAAIGIWMLCGRKVKPRGLV